MDVSSLPDISLPEMDFPGTSFFNPRDASSAQRQLPTPSAVRDEWLVQGRPFKIVKFSDLGMIVKFGQSNVVKLEEAQTMHAVRQLFPNGEVPVPELFGWRIDQGQTFIYMSIVNGLTFRDSWPSLTHDEKVSLCDQLSRIISTLRNLRQDPSDQFIGSMNRGDVQDIYFRHGSEGGPFPTVKAFNDWVQLSALPQSPLSQRPADPYRDFLPDLCNIHLTHGDLNLGNIMVSDDQGSRQITALIDWQQAGWYPEYWEYCKALAAEPHWHEWRMSGWSETFMKPYEDEWVAFSEYWMWKCPG